MTDYQKSSKAQLSWLPIVSLHRVSTNITKQISSRLPGHILTKFQFLHGDGHMPC